MAHNDDNDDNDAVEQMEESETKSLTEPPGGALSGIDEQAGGN